MELCRGRVRWELGKGFSVVDRGMGWAVLGSGHGCEQLELKEHSNAALKRRVWIWGSSVWSQEVDLMTPVGPFQLGLFCDSMIVLLGSNPGHRSGLVFPVPFPELILQDGLSCSVHPPA